MAPFHFPRRSHESPQFAASWQEIQKNLPENKSAKGELGLPGQVKDQRLQARVGLNPFDLPC
jgi:hypothetical protein